jgi:hypothetical protein
VRRTKELRYLRAAHARYANLEIRERNARETIRALTWQVSRAARRLGQVQVTELERTAHFAAARKLGEAHQQLIRLAAEGRRLRASIRIRTLHLQGRGRP